ncbi:MAG: hypothetical protein JWR19_823 [Pedosphaera sp.]|nr:hypothetical protein [Pedosphaera sp.]
MGNIWDTALNKSELAGNWLSASWPRNASMAATARPPVLIRALRTEFPTPEAAMRFIG